MTPNDIKTLRRKYNLTQRQLSLITGIHKMTISKWERGLNKPTGINLTVLTLIKLNGKIGIRMLKKIQLYLIDN